MTSLINTLHFWIQCVCLANDGAPGGCLWGQTEAAPSGAKGQSLQATHQWFKELLVSLHWPVTPKITYVSSRLDSEVHHHDFPKLCFFSPPVLLVVVFVCLFLFQMKDEIQSLAKLHTHAALFRRATTPTNSKPFFLNFYLMLPS